MGILRIAARRKGTVITMVRKNIEVTPEAWTKAKSSAEFIQKASEYKSSVWVEKDNKKANAKSLLGLLALEIAPGCGLQISAQGEDEEEAVAALCHLMTQNV